MIPGAIAEKSTHATSGQLFLMPRSKELVEGLRNCWNNDNGLHVGASKRKHKESSGLREIVGLFAFDWDCLGCGGTLKSDAMAEWPACFDRRTYEYVMDLGIKQDSFSYT